jgi:DNA polymerase-1
MLIILDGTNLVRRAYHAGGTLTLDDFARRVHRQLGEEARIAIAWDAKQPYWRHELWADYKAHRHDDPQAAAFVRTAARAAKGAGVPGYYAEQMEADDVAATLVAQAADGDQPVVVSTDKDWCQMLADGARWLSPVNGGGLEERTEEWVFEHYGIGPALWPEFTALAGDPSDGIPGIRGIGPKRAAELLREHGTAAAVAAALYPDDLERVRIFKRIATLCTEANLLEV